MTFQIVQLACESIAVAGLLVAIGYLRRAARYSKITRKLYQREPLTDREQHLLDKAGR